METDLGSNNVTKSEIHINLLVTWKLNNNTNYFYYVIENTTFSNGSQHDLLSHAVVTFINKRLKVHEGELNKRLQVHEDELNLPSKSTIKLMTSLKALGIPAIAAFFLSLFTCIIAKKCKCGTRDNNDSDMNKLNRGIQQVFNSFCGVTNHHHKSEPELEQLQLDSLRFEPEHILS